MKPFSLLATIATLSTAVLPLLTPSCGGSTETNQTGSGSGGASGTMGTGTAGTNAAGSGASGTSVVGPGGGQQGGGAGTVTTVTETCSANEECTWGEITHEILAATDCICLYGCPFLPQTKVTAARRMQQHMALCNPTMNGKGQSCGVDDCSRPGAVACIDGMCKAAPKDAGTAD